MQPQNVSGQWLTFCISNEKSTSFLKAKCRTNCKNERKNDLEGEACTILASSSFLLRSRKNENSLGDTPNTPVRK